MTFKEFNEWCNKRACDGCWNLNTAKLCIELITTMGKVPFWKREKEWERHFKDCVQKEIINPIEDKIKMINKE